MEKERHPQEQTMFELEWKKNWSGRWSACFGSFYGWMYTEGIHKEIGAHLRHNLIVHEPSASSNYLVKEEIAAFGKHLASIVERNPALLAEWCDIVIKRTDEILDLVKSLDKKKTIDAEEFISLREAAFRHVPYNFFVKKIADYLPSELLDAHLERFSMVRTYTEAVYDETDRILQKTLRQVKDAAYPTSLLRTLTHREVERYLREGELPPAEALQNRSDGFALFYLEGEEIAVTGAAFKRLMELLTATPSAELRGTVAYPGRARGRVRIVFDPAQATFRRGDILVTGMTRPDFLQLMELSAAFVTDAGGILSHAAIVARELKKPCIVGTERATKALKDGDLVEVDAENGVVRKISDVETAKHKNK